MDINMSIELSTFSRFFQTEPIVKDDIETFGLWKRPDFLKLEELGEDDLITIIIDSNLAGRPDQISLMQYGTPFLEWVVIMFNRPQNPLGWPRLGSIIKIPRKSLVRQFV